MQNAADVGQFLLREARGAGAAASPLSATCAGRGLMIGLELVRDRQTKERAASERDALVMAAFRRGLLVLAAGANTVRLSPPLVITREQAQTAVSILDDALGEISNS